MGECVYTKRGAKITLLLCFHFATTQIEEEILGCFLANWAFFQVPNGLGVVFGLAQLVLYATFYRSTKKQALERQVKWEMGLAATTISGLDSTKTSRVAQNGHAPYVNGT